LKSVAIIGGAKSTAQFAPFNDPEWETWGMAWHAPEGRAFDLLFDIHDPKFKADPPYTLHWNSHKNLDYINYANGAGVPVICHPDAQFKNGTPYPLEEVLAALPRRDFLECTISYMVALAIVQGRKRIGLWGCHFTGKDEYQYQLPSLTWLLGYAEAKGIEIVIGPGGPLLASGYNMGRYGITHDVRPRDAGPTDWAERSMSIPINGRPVRFSVPSNEAIWRVETIETKEPQTVEWIKNLPPNSCLWDIGASIGIYSAYAAAYGHKVIAVEADEGHAETLAKSIWLSAMGDQVTVVHRTMNDLYTIDRLVKQAGYESPTCIKIDTDGCDLAVVKGAMNALRNGVRSVIVETDERNPADKNEIDRLLTEAGFTMTGRYKRPGKSPSWPIGMDHWHKEF
jgi:predicted RNA methylase